MCMEVGTGMGWEMGTGIGRNGDGDGLIFGGLMWYGMGIMKKEIFFKRWWHGK